MSTRLNDAFETVAVEATSQFINRNASHRACNRASDMRTHSESMTR